MSSYNFIVMILICDINTVLTFLCSTQINHQRIFSLVAYSQAEETSDYSLFLSNIISSCKERVQSAVTLKNHPGFTFGLGCHKWSGSGFTGKVDGWSGAPKISWVASSVFMSAEEIRPYAQADLNIFVSAKFDAPHLRMMVCSSPSGYHLLLDAIPREDLVTSIEHFDKYFKGVDAWVARAETDPLVNPRGPSPIFLSRILKGPLALDVDVVASPEGKDLVAKLCLEQVDRWCTWIASCDERNTSEINTAFSRDASMHKLREEEAKFSLAALFNPDFAPKAAELAAALVGPDYDTLSLA